MVARSITEVKPGDFVKVGPNHYEEIIHIAKDYGDRPPLPHVVPRHWTIITKTGRKVRMYEAHSYHKKEDLQDRK